jgi:NAD(P)-dependent dehydrogenase (short-subunit alcohol dehydrogenase family)
MELPYFTGRGVLVVGGTRGIGRATADAFAAAGARVAVIGSADADVRDEAQLAVAVDDAVTALGGRLDVAVNAAGVFGAGSVHELDEATWDRVIDINLKGTWLAMKHELRHMRPHRAGTIVNIASNLGAHATRPGIAPYAASKAGVSALTRTAALEAIADGIRINAVSPGPVRTPMSLRPGETDPQRDARIAASLPIGRIGEPAEIADAILWLASPASSFAVGHDVVLDGGFAAA